MLTASSAVSTFGFRLYNSLMIIDLRLGLGSEILRSLND